MPSSPSPVWDPRQYLRHSGNRARPLHDLLARVPELPRSGPRIADLGCGPGGPSTPLAARWPTAHLTGYDNSPAMLEEARALAGPTEGGGSIDFVHADLAHWRPGPGEVFDLIFSNAALQWVPGHTASFPAWVDGLTPGGVLAFQVPGNSAAPSHALFAELCASPRWRGKLGGDGPPRGTVLDPAGYHEALAALGCEVDTWETTYLHVLEGEDAVLDWVKGTALRPVLSRLDGDEEARDAFLAEYGEALRAAYPPGPYGTPFPFRRVFAVARKR
ncbi:trans-aconitate 2-methyltransferase [Streptomyces daliensis]|uniref:Trans-aconitate 2-methyltransferase n=1 Tax=Streptomyces daliensis TaxID=299421 RepID=A0A8T4IVT1_9ACTN|nr:trans-aconitate 2-methyltransferase [Streptomyces daliensis]